MKTLNERKYLQIIWDQYPKCIKNSYNSGSKDKISQLNSGQRMWLRHFSKEDMQMANRHTCKKCLPSLNIREMQRKIRDITSRRQASYHRKDNQLPFLFHLLQMQNNGCYLNNFYLQFWPMKFLTFSLTFAAAALLQSCPTLCDPIDGSPPGSPSLGFSRQEHWSGVSLPSPMHESEKGKWSHSVVADS